jgi:hypothetical protein
VLHHGEGNGVGAVLSEEVGEGGVDVEAAVGTGGEDEVPVARTKGRFTVTVQRKGSAKSVVAEVELLPQSGVEGKGKKEEEEGREVWEVQLDCLKCENALD